MLALARLGADDCLPQIEANLRRQTDHLAAEPTADVRRLRELIDGLFGLMHLADPSAGEFLEWLLARTRLETRLAVLAYDTGRALTAARQGRPEVTACERHTLLSAGLRRELAAALAGDLQ